MDEPAKFDVFINYSEADKDWVTAELMPRLERAALKVCLDRRDFEVGAPIIENIAKGVKTSRFTLLVLTQAWVEDGLAQFAAQLAVTLETAAQRRKIISLRLQRNLLLTADWIVGLTELDFTEADAVVKWEHLLRQLRGDGAPTLGTQQIMLKLDERHRQIGPLARRALDSSSRSRIGLAALSLLPALLIAALGGLLFLGQEYPAWDLFAFALLPLVLQIGVLVFGLRAVGRARTRLEAACAATPLSTPAGPAACHVCGAPLAVSPDSIVRCGSCRADNIVDAKVLGRVPAARRDLFDDFAAAVIEQMTAVQRASRACALALVLTLTGGPMVAVIAACISAFALGTIETSVRPELRYAVVETRSGRCIALLTTYADHVRISYGGSDVPFEDRRSSDSLTIEPATASLGRRVVLPGRAGAGRIRRVFGTWIGNNEAEVAFDGGGVDRHSIEGLCLAP